MLVSINVGPVCFQVSGRRERRRRALTILSIISTSPGFAKGTFLTSTGQRVLYM